MLNTYIVLPLEIIILSIAIIIQFVVNGQLLFSQLPKLETIEEQGTINIFDSPPMMYINKHNHLLRGTEFSSHTVNDTQLAVELHGNHTENTAMKWFGAFESSDQLVSEFTQSHKSLTKYHCIGCTEEHREYGLTGIIIIKSLQSTSGSTKSIISREKAGTICPECSEKIIAKIHHHSDYDIDLSQILSATI